METDTYTILVIYNDGSTELIEKLDQLASIAWLIGLLKMELTGSGFQSIREFRMIRDKK